METFGQRLVAARKRRKLNQKQLAIKAGLSQTTISDIERERNAGSTAVMTLARALGVSADWLADGKGQMDAGALTDATPNESISQIAMMLEGATEAVMKAALTAVRDITTMPARKLAEPTPKDYLPAAIVTPIPLKPSGLPTPLNEILQCAQSISAEGQFILLGRAQEIATKYPAAKANLAS